VGKGREGKEMNLRDIEVIYALNWHATKIK
jgi:hypothetical protein